MKYLLALLLLTNSIFSLAQFSKGDKVLAGYISTGIDRSPNGTEGGYNRGTSFDISPTFGVLISERLEIGGMFLYSSHSYHNKTTTPYLIEFESKSVRLMGGAYLQKYYVIKGNFLFSILGSINYGTSKVSVWLADDFSERTETESKVNNAEVNIRPNLIFLPSANWALRAGIGNISYIYSKNKDFNEGANLIDFNLGSIGLGVSYYFRD